MSYFNIIKRRTLLKLMQDFPAAKTALQLWLTVFNTYDFKNFNELKAVYKNASVVANNRVVFNIKGNDFRLVVKINFYSKQVFIIWFGTHDSYNTIDVTTVRYREQLKKVVMENTTNTWKIIKTEEEYNKTLDRLELIFDAVPGSAEFDEVELLGLLIKDYEDKYYSIPLPNPIEAIKIRMEELGLQNSDLQSILGSEKHVTAILNKRQQLTLQQAQDLHYWLDIPLGVFINSDNLINNNSNFAETHNSSKDKIMKLKEWSLNPGSRH